MTDEKLKKAQELKRTISNLENELDKFNGNPEGINVFLHNVGTLIEDVKQVFIRHKNDYTEQFRKL